MWYHIWLADQRIVKNQRQTISLLCGNLLKIARGNRTVTILSKLFCIGIPTIEPVFASNNHQMYLLTNWHSLPNFCKMRIRILWQFEKFWIFRTPCCSINQLRIFSSELLHLDFFGTGPGRYVPLFDLVSH